MATSPNSAANHSAANQDSCYTSDPFRLDVAGTSLYRGAENAPLTPRVFDTLLALVSESGRTLSKDELIERVGPGVAAASQPEMESALSALRAARRSLIHANADKAGYRLNAIKLTDQAIAEVQAGIDAR